jgi:dienelactone hydrolase
MNALTRRELILGALVSGTMASSARGQESVREVPWLAEIQRVPGRLPENAPRLASLLVNSDGKPIATLAEWKGRRQENLRLWEEFLGPSPVKRQGVPKWKVVEEDKPDGIIRQLIRYEVEPGLSTDAYLLKPTKGEGKKPGVVVLHSTVANSIRQPSGVEGAPEKAFGLQLAKKGCVVICPRNYLWPTTDKISAQPEATKFLKRAPKTKGMMKMLYDSQVATDILASLPEVDAKRLGAVGHSLGAKESLYLAAFDERIKATVSSEGGIGTKFSNWNADWYLGKAIDAPDFPREHHELIALIAPRAFLLVGGESADGDRGWPFIEAAKKVYDLYGTPARLGQFNHRQGHAVPPEAAQKIEEWLLTYL